MCVTVRVSQGIFSLVYFHLWRPFYPQTAVSLLYLFSPFALKNWVTGRYGAFIRGALVGVHPRALLMRENVLEAPSSISSRTRLRLRAHSVRPRVPKPTFCLPVAVTIWVSLICPFALSDIFKCPFSLCSSLITRAGSCHRRTLRVSPGLASRRVHTAQRVIVCSGVCVRSGNANTSDSWDKVKEVKVVVATPGCFQPVPRSLCCFLLISGFFLRPHALPHLAASFMFSFLHARPGWA